MPSTLGCSLPMDYLIATAPEDLPEAAARCWASWGNSEQALPWLAKRGVSAIELRAVAYGARTEPVLYAAQRAWGAGMFVTVHAALPCRANQSLGADLATSYPTLVALLEQLPQGHPPLVATVHACPDASLEQSMRKSAAMFRELLIQTRASGLPLRWALEIDRAKGLVEPCISYQGVLDLLVAVDDPALGICWDLGHTVANVSAGLLTRDAPEAFVSRVIHTHIHDLGPEGRTHCALRPDGLPLTTWVPLLAQRGYGGVYNLELSPERMVDHGPWLALLEASLAALTNAIAL